MSTAKKVGQDSVRLQHRQQRAAQLDRQAGVMTEYGYDRNGNLVLENVSSAN